MGKVLHCCFLPYRDRDRDHDIDDFLSLFFDMIPSTGIFGASGREERLKYSYEVYPEYEYEHQWSATSTHLLAVRVLYVAEIMHIRGGSFQFLAEKVLISSYLRTYMDVDRDTTSFSAR